MFHSELGSTHFVDSFYFRNKMVLFKTTYIEKKKENWFRIYVTIFGLCWIKFHKIRGFREKNQSYKITKLI